MYSTFPVSSSPGKDTLRKADQPKPKRHHVPIACESCRKNRIKCDNSRPCRNCKHRNITCTNVDTTDVRALTRQVQHLLGRVQTLEARVQDFDILSPSQLNELSATDPTRTTPHQSRLIQSSTAQNERDNQQRPIDISKEKESSAVRVNLSTSAFAADLGHQIRSPLPHPLTAELVAYQSPVSTPGPSRIVSENIPRALADYYIRLYGRTIQRIMPVLDEDDIQAHCAPLWNEPSYCPGKSALADIMLALSLLMDANARSSQNRGFVLSAFSGARDPKQDQVRLMSNRLFRRCAVSLSEDNPGPSLSSLQCYILMTVYCRNDSNHTMAYQLLGLAMRIGCLLDIFHTPSQTLPQKERRLRRRLGEILYCLDTQQFLEFGRPPAIVDGSSTTLQAQPESLTQEHEDANDEDDVFLTNYVQLVRIAKVAHHLVDSEATPVRQSRVCQQHQQTNFCSNATLLEQLERNEPRWREQFRSWTATVPDRLQLRRSPHSRGQPFSTETALILDLDKPTWRLRQALLLELSYHWFQLGLLRPFMGQQHNQIYAQEAAQHALALTRITNQALLETDTIYGWYDSHFMLWDAALSLMGYTVLCANSGSSLTAEVKGGLSMCETTFEALGTPFTDRAAELIGAFMTQSTTLVGDAHSKLRNRGNTANDENPAQQCGIGPVMEADGGDMAGEEMDLEQMMFEETSNNLHLGFQLDTLADAASLLPLGNDFSFVDA
ncbi:uncharacterized transcriptional regulatory protein C530.05 [Aspergillus udagawae]|uniref:Uncharacterized transcriptional regulatory protein C530.05 n=1 Tax=Aspergillus udagawae TaxID=91492 RepID=A0ABQ1BAK0_9EURO|nr:uncharacterized transcriptional regulatory protein C530.05 [Aspergillus udagawae]GFF34918.1 uncharacterized transcriptional regulatory protein C530.05 [Aspergillus udagawae]GFF96965.1 uncharacterized transcriptional regulatory protein C530.05 [Aspergillus udagawae]GFG00729.1 uncharacterized transcriptional regulatory protein C530.05 [Aspergillus udagawae]